MLPKNSTATPAYVPKLFPRVPASEDRVRRASASTGAVRFGHRRPIQSSRHRRCGSPWRPPQGHSMPGLSKPSALSVL
jgi:hypothetical protein